MSLTGRGIMKDASWTLVHGFIHLAYIPTFPIPHAWLERQGNVYDAVFDVQMPTADYVALHRAVVKHRFSQLMAARLLATTDLYKAWTDDEIRRARRQ
jgi:hypothetical protein